MDVTLGEELGCLSGLWQVKRSAEYVYSSLWKETKTAPLGEGHVSTTFHPLGGVYRTLPPLRTIREPVVSEGAEVP